MIPNIIIEKSMIKKQYSSEINEIKEFVKSNQITGILDVVYGSPIYISGEMFVIQYLGVKGDTVYLYDVDGTEITLLNAMLCDNDAINATISAIEQYKDWLMR